MNPYIEKLKQRLADDPPVFGDGASIPTILYETYAEGNQMDDETAIYACCERPCSK